MRVYTSRYFDKQFEKLNLKIQRKFFERLNLFLKDHNHPLLKNHSLKGDMVGCRAFSVTGDFRAIYRIIEKDEIKFVDIGTHPQVY